MYLVSIDGTKFCYRISSDYTKARRGEGFPLYNEELKNLEEVSEIMGKEKMKKIRKLYVKELKGGEVIDASVELNSFHGLTNNPKRTSVIIKLERK